MARILLIDDDESILSLERSILTSQGHEALLADDPQEGIKILQVYPVDLIIVDVNMPRMNGFQFANYVKNSAEYKAPHIAFLTTRAESKDVVRAIEIGADFYLTKPIQREEYLKKIGDFFEKHPPSPRSVIHFTQLQTAETRVITSAQVLSMSDLTIELLIEKDVELDQILEVSSPLFYEIPLKNLTGRVISIKPMEGELKKVGLMFFNMDLETVRKIQRWVYTKKIDSSSKVRRA